MQTVNDKTRLVFADDFNRADGEVGQDWKIISGNWVIKDKALCVCNANGAMIANANPVGKDIRLEFDCLGDERSDCNAGVALKPEEGTGAGYLFCFGAKFDKADTRCNRIIGRDKVMAEERKHLPISGKWQHVVVEKQGRSLKLLVDNETSLAIFNDERMPGEEGEKFVFCIWGSSAKISNVKVFSLPKDPLENGLIPVVNDYSGFEDDAVGGVPRGVVAKAGSVRVANIPAWDIVNQTALALPDNCVRLEGKNGAPAELRKNFAPIESGFVEMDIMAESLKGGSFRLALLGHDDAELAVVYADEAGVLNADQGTSPPIRMEYAPGYFRSRGLRERACLQPRRWVTVRIGFSCAENSFYLAFPNYALFNRPDAKGTTSSWMELGRNLRFVNPGQTVQAISIRSGGEAALYMDNCCVYGPAHPVIINGMDYKFPARKLLGLEYRDRRDPLDLQTYGLRMGGRDKTKEDIFSAARPGGDRANPYLPLLGGKISKLMADDFASFLKKEQARKQGNREMNIVGMDAANEWINSRTAEMAFERACAHEMPGKWQHSEECLRQVEHLMQDLLEASSGDRWYHGQAGKGDPNIDRFTLLPFMEAYYMLGEHLPPGLSEQICTKFRNVMNNQIREYGSFRSEYNPYPNMDVYYCLIMLLGSKLFSDVEYYKEYLRFVNILVKAQFEDGALTYINWTNECPGYHDLNIALIGRIYDLSRDERVLNLIRKSIPYYPQVVLPAGLAECHTDPWWKHTWGTSMNPSGPDIVASLTGDGQNRSIGNMLWGKWGECHFLYGYYAARLWRDVPEEPIPLNVVFDKNIQGPRGRFAKWAWAATSRYGSDTIIGASFHEMINGNIVALLGITPEIGRYDDDGGNYSQSLGLGRQSLGITPLDALGETVINGNEARFSTRYPMACFRSIWGGAPYPVQWDCRQEWELTPYELRGKIKIISMANQKSPGPTVTVRFGRNLKLIENSNGQYEYGPFRLTILNTDLQKMEQAPATACSYEKGKDATQLILKDESGSISNSYSKGQSFAVDLSIKLCDP